VGEREWLIELIESTPTRVAAAQEMVCGLMRGSKSELKLGYTAQAAYMAAVALIELSKMEKALVEVFALGFGVGLNGVNRVDGTELMKVEGAVPSQELLVRTFQDAVSKGWQEFSSGLTYPTGVGVPPRSDS